MRLIRASRINRTSFLRVAPSSLYLYSERPRIPSLPEICTITTYGLEGPIIVGSMAGLEFSLDDAIYLSSLSLPAEYSGDIYIRLDGSREIDGSLEISSEGVIPVSVGILGEVGEYRPGDIEITGISDIGSEGFYVNWEIGEGDNELVYLQVATDPGFMPGSIAYSERIDVVEPSIGAPVTGLDPITSYWVRARVEYEDIYGEYSEVVPTATVAAPGNIIITGISDIGSRSFYVSWEIGEGDNKRVYLQVATDPDFLPDNIAFSGWTDIAEPCVGTSVTGLEPTTTYWVRARIEYDDIYGEYCASVSDATYATLEISDFSLTSEQAYSAQISWTTNRPATTVITYKMVGGPAWLPYYDSGEALSTSHSREVIPLVMGTTYEVRAQSFILSPSEEALQSAGVTIQAVATIHNKLAIPALELQKFYAVPLSVSLSGQAVSSLPGEGEILSLASNVVLAIDPQTFEADTLNVSLGGPYTNLTTGS